MLAFVVAVLEARSVTASLVEGGADVPPFLSLLLGDIGVLFPVAVFVGCMTGALSFALEPAHVKSPAEHLAELRSGSVVDRLRKASSGPLFIFAAFGWCLASAHVARTALAEGKPQEVGLTLGVTAVGLLLASVAVAVAILPSLRRALAAGSAYMPGLADPALTSTFALVVVMTAFAFGISSGDTGGSTGVLGIFGVLKRAELDLRPVANIALLVAGAYLTPVAFGRARFVDSRGQPHSGAVALSLVAFSFVFVVGGLCTRASSALGAEPSVAKGLERHAPLGKVSLAGLRRITDHDRDGYSAQFGGADCNDRDARVNPAAPDEPGNGVDEDCSGADTPEAPAVVATPTPPETQGSKKPKLKRSYNVILITVDTLRIDLGFMGYPKPVSPNLDKLALESTVFDRAYSMASYTGKSVGPFLIGKYPSETLRDGGHFNTYFPANTFVTERVHNTGVRTFAGMCHWYFRMPTGLNQGMDVWDTSAIPQGMGDNDTSITGERMSDLALKLLMRPENTTPGAVQAADAGVELVDAAVASAPGSGDKHFFGWFHFFDPHAQYIAHEGSPVFTGPYPAKNLYDQEVWFTDKQIGKILDYVASQPWGKDTAIILTADHGEAFADHGMSWHGAEIWESLVRVPLVIHLPDVAARRVQVKRSHIDLAPTILDIMGVPQPEDENELRGVSLIDDVLAASNADHLERDVYIDMPPGPYNGVRRAVITGPTPGMKLIHSGGGSYQLFDLANDPNERRDLSSNKELLSEVLSHMQSIRARIKEIDVKVEPP